MTKQKKNRVNTQANRSNVLGPYGPVSSTKTTIGVNTMRISNARPSILPPEFSVTNLNAAIAEAGKNTGRHLFADPTAAVALPVNTLPNVPTKDASYVLTNALKNCIASQTTVDCKIANGRSRYELCIPYYDREAHNTLSGSSELLGAIAPMGSFKIGLDIHGGGVMTGTDANGMLALDHVMIGALKDLVDYVSSQAGTRPLFAASGFGVIPASA